MRGVPQFKKKQHHGVNKYHLLFSEHATFLVSYDAPNKQEGKKKSYKRTPDSLQILKQVVNSVGFDSKLMLHEALGYEQVGKWIGIAVDK